MRTTLDLDDALLDEAMTLMHLRTKTGAIHRALEEVIQKYKVRDIMKYKGKVHLDIDLDASRKR